jgi:hypothetical protein
MVVVQIKRKATFKNIHSLKKKLSLESCRDKELHFTSPPDRKAHTGTSSEISRHSTVSVSKFSYPGGCFILAMSMRMACQSPIPAQA